MPRGGDPTAAMAERNIEAGRQAGALVIKRGPHRIWLDEATIRHLLEKVLRVQQDSEGTLYGRINEEAPAPAATGDEGENDQNPRRN